MRATIRKGVISAACALLLGALGVQAVQAQAPRQLPLFPSAVFRGVATPARYFRLDLAVVEYGPGAISSAASEQSTRFFTVIEGELTFTVGGKTETVGVGKNFSVLPGVVAMGSNAGRSTRARVYISSLIPARGEGAIMLAGAPPSAAVPKTLYSMRLPVGPLPAVIDVVQAGTKYEPGFVTGTHTMNEVHAILHLDGTTSYEYWDGMREAFAPGQGGQMYVGQPGAMANRTASPAAFLITWLVTPGKPLTSPWSHPGH
jgi:quercetin dioxygenase-like cupin family protein